MSWFKRHPNLTWLLSVLALAFVTRAAVAATPDEAAVLIWIVGIAGAFLVTLWLLREKHRRWEYALLIFVPFGWIGILALRSHSEVFDIVNGKIIKRRREEGD